MSRNQSKQNSRAPSGTSTPAVVEAAVPAGPVCASINFGQSFSSVAIINKVRPELPLTRMLAEKEFADSDRRRALRTALQTTTASDRSLVPSRSTAPRRYDPRRPCARILLMHFFVVHRRASASAARA